MGFFDAALLRTLVVAVFSAWLGAWFINWLERRPKLIAFLWHATGVAVPPAIPVAPAAAGPGFTVNVHSVVLRNTGRKPSTNVRLGHAPLANLSYSVFPAGLHTEHRLPDNGIEIRFDRLVPDQEMTITYLYFHPTLWHHVNTHIQDDHGKARVLNVLPQAQAPRWVRRSLLFLVLVGAVAVLYVAVRLVRTYWPLLETALQTS